jgi:hypothetical protein
LNSPTARTYKVELEPDSSAFVISKRIEATQVKQLKNECTFEIDTKNFLDEAGIYVNIVGRLRQDERTGKCIDYLELKYNDGENDVRKRLCGTFDRNSVEVYKGEVSVTLFVNGNKPMSADDFIEFEMAATAFKGKIRSH